MSEQRGEAAPRPGRCAVHPTASAVGNCEACGRPLCLACAIPVRGALVGGECLSVVLEEVAEPVAAPAPIGPRGEALTLTGFGLVVAVSVLPWSRYGDASGFLQAWTPHWSLLAAAAALAGLVVTIAWHRRPRDPRLEAAAIAGLALLVVMGAGLHALRPPSAFSRVWAYAWIAPMAGAALALIGAAMRIAPHDEPSSGGRRSSLERAGRG